MAVVGVGSQTHAEKTVGSVRAEAWCLSLALAISEVEQSLWPFGALFRQASLVCGVKPQEGPEEPRLCR